MQLPNIIEKSGQRVLTTTQIAEAYGTDSKKENLSYGKYHIQR